MKRRSESAARSRLAIAGCAVAGVLASFAMAHLVAPPLAYAYCRTTSCAKTKEAGEVCSPATADDCGIPLFWPKQCVGFTLQKDASSQVSLAEAEVTFQQAFAAWTEADCGGGQHPSIQIDYMGTVECDEQEYNKKKANANVILFRDDGWPYEGGGNVLALTTVTYNLDNGEIYDADLELNSDGSRDITVGDEGKTVFDLLSIATHETGHFLGVAHSAEDDATMFVHYQQGTKALRDLTGDDSAAICAIYPPGQPQSATCDNVPRHGFSALCGTDQPEPGQGGGCAVSMARPERGALPGFAGLAALAGAGLLVSRRRKSRRHPGRES